MDQGQTAHMKRDRKEERSVGTCCGFGRQLSASSIPSPYYRIPTYSFLYLSFLFRKSRPLWRTKDIPMALHNLKAMCGRRRVCLPAHRW